MPTKRSAAERIGKLQPVDLKRSSKIKHFILLLSFALIFITAGCNLPLNSDEIDDKNWEETSAVEPIPADEIAPPPAPIASAWQAGLPQDSELQPIAFEQRLDGALRISDPSSDASDQNPAI